MLAVKSNEPLWVNTERGPAPVAVRELAQALPDADWHRLSAGDGSKGPRFYDWARVPLRPRGGAGPGLLAAGASQRRRPSGGWPTTLVAALGTCRWPNWCA